MLNVTMLSVPLLSVTILSVTLLSVTILNVTAQSLFFFFFDRKQRQAIEIKGWAKHFRFQTEITFKNIFVYFDPFK